MAVNDLITFRKGPASQWISVNPVLASGEPGYDLTNSILKIGDGVSNWVALSGIGSTSVGGSSSSSVGVRGIISTTGTLSSFSVSGGYSAGYLDLFQNGVKLLSGSDFTATDGTSVTLSNSVPSGTVLEYISLGTSISSSNYTKLDNISSSFNGSSTSFGLAVSGTPYYPVSANTLGIYVGGVAQEPISSYSVSGSNIIFTEAPASGLTFWGVGYGTTAVATLNGIVPGSVSSPAISSSNDLTSGFYFPSSGSLAIASSGYDRFKIDNKGDIFVGGENINSLRYLDINNINSGSNAGSILRLITTNVSGVSNVSADIIKRKNGQFSINNSETNSAAFTSFNIGDSEKLRITSSGNIGIGTTVPSTLLDINNDKFRVRNSKSPSSPSDSGNQGDICWDLDYIYVCISTNSWVRTPISSWINDPYFSNVSLLLHMNGSGSTFVDNSPSPKTASIVGVGGTQSSTQRRFGRSSLQLTAGSHLSVNGGDDFRFGTGDFVVELWAYPTATPNGGGLISSEYFASSQVGFTIAFSNSGTLGSVSGSTLFTGFYNSGSWKGISSSSSLTLNTWNYIAVSRISGTYSLYLNDVLLGTLFNNTVLPDVQPFRIGRDWSGEGTLNGSFVGYIDEIRITKGNGRGYTGSVITVPTEPFSNYST